MKRILSAVLLSVAVLASAQDPTQPGSQMADALRQRSLATSSLRLQALVVGAEGDGLAILGADGADGAIVHAGSTVSQTVDGMRVSLRVKSVTPDGVEIETSGDAAPIVVSGGFRPLPAPETIPAEFLRYLEASQVPLDRLLRLVSDQTGVNIAASEATKGKTVSILLRNVDATVAIEEICRVTGLWFRRDNGSSVIRVTSMDEYEQNLVSFREEKTETFTLNNTPVMEVAAVLCGLYPERVLFSFGEEDFLDDEQNDLGRRFERFRTIADAGGSAFLKMDAPNASYSSSSSSGSGVYTYSDEAGIRRVGERRGPVSAAEAKALDRALAAGDTNAVDRISGQTRGASIFVTISRRNNRLLVRTSDLRVLDDIRERVKDLDVPTPMVLLELKVLELDVDDDFTSEFQYGYEDDRSGDRTATYGFPGFDPLKHSEPRTDAFSFRFLGDSLQARIQLLQKNGRVKTLATPNLLVANNEVSRLFIGEERPIVKNITSQSIVTENSTVTVPQTEIEFEDVGTLLLVTPNINADRTITLKLLQENSEIVRNAAEIPVYSVTTGNAVEKVPVDVVSSRSIAGTFIAKDGLAVAAGGLIKETESIQKTKVPILGDIPLLGWFFRSTEKVKARKELMVLIRPHVISTPADAEQVSQDFLGGVSVHSARDGRPSLNILTNETDSVFFDPPPLKDIVR